MTRLDENRAKSQLAKKAGVPVADVSNMTIWGNHSATQYPDFFNAKISGKPVTDSIQEQDWLSTEFIKRVQQRGAEIIKARGASSAASAANAVVDTVRSLIAPTPSGDWFSVAVCSDGSYGVEKGLMASFPVRSNGKNWEIVQNVPLNEFGKEKLNTSVQELIEERDTVKKIFGTF